ncbi:MAG: gliding motility-associated C-terminal domain-containing protein [Bacteroidia bacterium]|nr:gliding motility-associated C-terminal domain-containing protein [Bacteroidia bacterium]
MKRKLVFCLVLFCSFTGIFSSNIIGGDITWTCAGTGNFTFKLRLHVQCGGPAMPASYNINVFNHPTVTSIPVNLLGPSDISPTCGSSGATITCIGGGPGAVSEYLYVSAPVALPGVPPAGGWVFTFTDCCRTANANLNVSATTGITLYSKMFSVNGANSNPCYDSSPDFLNPPDPVLCTGYSNIINFDAFDADLDSLNIKWAEPLDDFAGSFTPPINPVPVAFNTGYLFTNPFPNPSTGAGNVGAVLYPLSGNIEYTSLSAGTFSYALIYESYRCGQKVSEVFKEFQLVMKNCGVNPPPTMSAPFAGIYETSVVAGTLVNFTLNAVEASGQDVLWEAYGNEFGAGYTNAAAGCTQPPCATLNPVPPAPSPGANSVTFNWQTDCAHLGSPGACSLSDKTYRFYFTAKDDTCPVPALNNKTIIIHVTPPPILLSPEIRCVSVDAANNVTLTWVIPPDPTNSFISYQIFSSPTLNGVYTNVTTINTYNQTQYTITAGPGVLSKYYFIKSFGCGGFVGSAAVDTVRPILLNVNNPANGTALLSWNAFVTPLPATSCGWYKIYKEYPAGTWVPIDSTQTLSCIDTIDVCSSQINYRVEICDASGCNSVSTIDGDIFQDLVDPSIPLTDSVSMDAVGNAVIGWTPSTSGDVVAYIIYQTVGGINIPIDTVYGSGSSFYNYLNSNANAGSETYCISAFDSCGNLSNIGIPQRTLFLSKQYDVCSYTATLTWNAYINMTDGGLGQYDVYVSVNGSAFTLLGSTASTNYMQSNLISGNSYCYFIRAVSVNGASTSTSNKQCIIATTPNQPSFIYLKRVTVTTSQNVEVDCYIDNAPGVSMSGIELWSCKTNAGPFKLNTNISYNGAAQYTITDYEADPSQSNYYYYLLAKDSCDNPSLQSDTSRTILCKAWPNEDFTNTIIWNDYDMWLGGITSYNIYRSVNGIFSSVPVGNFSYDGSNAYTFSDDVSLLSPQEGEFVYYIEALEGSGNPYGFSETSNSNYAHVYREAEIFVPNAFAPRGKNKIFFPVTQYVSKTDYQFMIFNRWGQKIWETNDDTAGWDGSGDEGGVYIWVIQYKNSKGEFVEKKGSVTMVR